jgi:hypothetical protein
MCEVHRKGNRALSFSFLLSLSLIKIEKLPPRGLGTGPSVPHPNSIALSYHYI